MVHFFWNCRPKESQANSQGDGDEHSQDTVSISTSFFPDAHVFGSASDLILLATDSVYFYVHSHILLGVSQNGFNSMLPVSSPEGGDYFVAGPILPVSECASVLNIVLHTIYHTSFSQYSPSFNTLVEATSALKRYGVALESVITPSAPLYDILLTHAAAYPLDLFALAAENGLDDLAVATSNHLLSISLSTISDEMAVRIGPIFLKRLFFMHLGRSEVLRSILLPPPYPHTPTATCGSIQQTKLIRAWTLASAYLAWDARAGVS